MTKWKLQRKGALPEQEKPPNQSHTLRHRSLEQVQAKLTSMTQSSTVDEIQNENSSSCFSISSVLVRICIVFVFVIICLICLRIDALLPAKNQEQDDESKEDSQSDADGRQWCRPNRSIIHVAAVDDAVIQWLLQSEVVSKRNILPAASWLSSRIWINWSLEEFHLSSKQNNRSDLTQKESDTCLYMLSKLLSVL